MAIHTFMLSQTLSNSEYHTLLNDSTFQWKLFRNKQHVPLYCYTNKFKSEGISLLQLYAYDKKAYDSSNNVLFTTTYFFITITVNPDAFYGGTGHASTNTVSLDRAFLVSLMTKLFYISTIFSYPSLKLRRIDFALDIPTPFSREYLHLIKYGYPLTRYEKLAPLSQSVSDDIIDSALMQIDDAYVNNSYDPQDSIYYRNNSLNINIYHKYSQLIRTGRIATPNDDFLRIELQVKKPKLQSLMAKYNIPTRTPEDFLNPAYIKQVEYELFLSYLNMLCGSGTYVSKQYATSVITQKVTTTYRQNVMLNLLDDISKHHGVTAFLNYAKANPTKYGTVETVKRYLADINKLDINPVLLPVRCNAMTRQEDICNYVTTKYLPHLVTYLHFL